MPSSPFAFYEVVVVESSRPELREITGERGVVMDMSGEAEQWGYTVMIESSGVCWPVLADDLKSTGEIRRREEFYDGTSIRVSKVGEILGQLQGTMPPPFPAWSLPPNLSELIDQDPYGIWHDDVTFSPIKLSVMKGVVYAGRPIDLSWQIDFEPSGDEFESGNARLERMGLDADGYGWANLINSVFQKYHPDLAPELQFGDTEDAACVVWVESETTCRVLTGVAWSLIHAR